MQLSCSQKLPHAAAENFLLLWTGQRFCDAPALTDLLLLKYKQKSKDRSQCSIYQNNFYGYPTLHYGKADKGGRFLFLCRVKNSRRFMIDSSTEFVVTGRFTSSYQRRKSLSEMLTRQQLLGGQSISSLFLNVAFYIKPICQGPTYVYKLRPDLTFQSMGTKHSTAQKPSLTYNRSY